MGCDGIWETMTNEEIIQFCQQRMTNEGKLSAVIEELLENILAPNTTAGVGCDNMSCIIVQMKKL